MVNKVSTKSLFVSIVGSPNVGKSSLVNNLVGAKISIVSPKPQTTRNKIIGVFTKDNTQLVFTDTPGLHRPHTRLGDYMISEINSSFSGAEACIHVVEAGKKLSSADAKFAEKFKVRNIPIVLAINKIDVIRDKCCIIEQIKDFSTLFGYTAIVPVSAKTGDGKAELLEELFKLAVDSVFFFNEDDVTDQSERTLVCEIVREKLLRCLDKELPHGSAVFVERFHERPQGITDVEAIIYCERENHKGIIIGKGGQMLKKVGSTARLDLEKMLGRKINLKLWVKVKENWRNKDLLLNDLGYTNDNN